MEMKMRMKTRMSTKLKMSMERMKMKKKGKKAGLLLCAAAVVLLALAMPALTRAEVSTNLQLRTVYRKDNKRLIDYQTYVDDQGNVVVPADKGYATIRYSYGTSNTVRKIELLDQWDQPVNGTEGWSWQTKAYTRTKLAEHCYFDKDGNPVTGPEGFHRLENKYENLLLQSSWQYGPDGSPVNVHEIREYKLYSNNHLLTADTWYDAEGNLAPGPEIGRAHV